MDSRIFYTSNKCPNPKCKHEFSYKDYWFIKGHLLLEQKKYREAILHFNNALQINPSFIEALNDIGVCFDNLEILDKAMEAFNKILNIDLKNKLALYNIGAVNIKLKKYDKTAVIIEKLLELDSNYARAYYLRACLNTV